jgi:hypothetical protein
VNQKTEIGREKSRRVDVEKHGNNIELYVLRQCWYSESETLTPRRVVKLVVVVVVEKDPVPEMPNARLGHPDFDPD